MRTFCLLERINVDGGNFDLSPVIVSVGIGGLINIKFVEESQGDALKNALDWILKERKNIYIGDEPKYYLGEDSESEKMQIGEINYLSHTAVLPSDNMTS